MRKNKKTLILSMGRTNSFPIYAKNILENLEKNKFDVIVSKQSNCSIEGKNVIKIDTYSNKINFIIRTVLYLPYRFLTLLPKLYKEYDTLYLPYMHYWDWPFIIFFKLLKRKIINTAHDGLLHKGDNGIVLDFLNKVEIKISDELIVLTDYVKDLVVKNFKYNKPIYVVPHGLLENQYIDQNKTEDEGKRVLFLGRVSKYKGVEMLIESILKTSFENLIIAGKSNYKIEYIKDNRINIIDKYLTEKEIGELLTWANILVLPYLEASQSGVISLGISAELPMVCTNVGGFGEQLESDEAIWVNPNANELSSGIEYILGNLDERKRLIEKMKTKKTTLSWRTISHKISNIIFNTNGN